MCGTVLSFIIFLCWGSFLNAFAYRLITGGSLWLRSQCPRCQKEIAWFDLIPVISWVALNGNCRSCQRPISKLYPFIELLTAVSCTILVYTAYPFYFLSYFLFISALIVVIRTDLEFMLIPRLCSIYLVPVGIMLSALHRLPLTWQESSAGAAIGYGILAIVAYLYKKRTGVTGMGEGDPELLAGIGSFVGLTGVWHTLLVGSLSATAYAVALMVFYKVTSHSKIPFGPFLAFGALFYTFCL